MSLAPPEAAGPLRRERLRTGRHYGLTMEPRGVMAQWDEGAGRLTVFGAAKVPFFNRRILAKQIGLSEDQITMIENDVGMNDLTKKTVRFSCNF